MVQTGGIAVPQTAIWKEYVKWKDGDRCYHGSGRKVAVVTTAVEGM